MQLAPEKLINNLSFSHLAEFIELDLEHQTTLRNLSKLNLMYNHPNLNPEYQIFLRKEIFKHFFYNNDENFPVNGFLKISFILLESQSYVFMDKKKV